MYVCVFFTILADVGQISDDLVGLLPLVRRDGSCDRHGWKTEQTNYVLAIIATIKKNTPTRFKMIF